MSCSIEQSPNEFISQLYHIFQKEELKQREKTTQNENIDIQRFKRIECTIHNNSTQLIISNFQIKY